MLRLMQRLNQLEKAMHNVGGGKCPLCFGYPVAVLDIMHERDPNGPGFRKTGERFLIDETDRITDDLRCRCCGARAQEVHLMASVGIGPLRQGRRLCVD